MKEKNIHSDQKYIDALLKNDTLLISEIYDKYAPKIVAYVRKNNGDESRAKDLIQEVLITIYKQARENNFQLTCPFDAYFFLLCKRKWINELHKKSNNEVTIKEEIVSKHDESIDLVEETELFEAKNQLFSEMFNQLGQACKELLKLSFTMKSLEDVATKLNQSYGYVRKKKSLCIGKLTDLVRSAPRFNQIKNSL